MIRVFNAPIFVWPTWTAKGMRQVLATMLDRQAVYLRALLTAYKDPGAADMKRVDELRTLTRRARSNAEAIIEKIFSEPYGRHTVRGESPPPELLPSAEAYLIVDPDIIVDPNIDPMISEEIGTIRVRQRP